MSRERHPKVTGKHLARQAFLYVRQSTLHQAEQNRQSSRRQYALGQRAHSLGWPKAQVTVIDSDIGQSGADRDREGFKMLLAEVSLGNAGIVLGLEVSRLARNSSDWHQLLELCALKNTLILDEDGIYDPKDFNDRLVLGLKGQVSEMELHYLRLRLHGGIVNAARRGELRLPLPTGLVYDPLFRVVLDPDAQVRQTVMELFDTFTRTGSARACVKDFHARGLLFPRRQRQRATRGELVWEKLTCARTLQVLHNPRYAGAFAYGRKPTGRHADGGPSRPVPDEEFSVLLPDHHDGYITWQRYQANRQRLADNARHRSQDQSPAREGAALLQGLAICGRCGGSMTPGYRHSKAGVSIVYRCWAHFQDPSLSACQQVPGNGIDKAIGEWAVELLTPSGLDAALQVQQELEAQVDKTETWLARQLQRAQHEADLARTRFMNTHPDNRMVADLLESEWNVKLSELQQTRSECERRRAELHRQLGDEQRQRIVDLTRDLPQLWNDPNTPNRERKRMLRLLIDDVTITRGEQIELGIRLRGGATHQMTLALPQPGRNAHVTPAEVITAIDTLLEDHCVATVAKLLNQQGLHSGHGKAFTARRVSQLRHQYGLRSRYQRLRQRGLLTRDEMATLFAVSPRTIIRWQQRGLLIGIPFNDRNACLFERPATARHDD